MKQLVAVLGPRKWNANQTPAQWNDGVLHDLAIHDTGDSLSKKRKPTRKAAAILAASEQAEAAVEISLSGMELRTTDQAILSPRGFVRLPWHLYAICERLLHCPGAIVSRDTLIRAMYLHERNEPDAPDDVLRQRIKQLRSLIGLLTGNRIEIKTHREQGHSLARRA